MIPTVWKGEPTDDLTVRCRMTTEAGWLDLNDHFGYELEADTMNNRQVTHRKQEVQNPYVPGTFVVSSVPDNVIETVSVWVRGQNHYEMGKNIEVLEYAFSQLQYYMQWVVENHMVTWFCQVADYQVNTQREYRHARLAKFVAQVPRYPTFMENTEVIPGTMASPNG